MHACMHARRGCAVSRCSVSHFVALSLSRCAAGHWCRGPARGAGAPYCCRQLGAVVTDALLRVPVCVRVCGVPLGPGPSARGLLHKGSKRSGKQGLAMARHCRMQATCADHAVASRQSCTPHRGWRGPGVISLGGLPLRVASATLRHAAQRCTLPPRATCVWRAAADSGDLTGRQWQTCSAFVRR
jgi:hypothetical protein